MENILGARALAAKAVLAVRAGSTLESALAGLRTREQDRPTVQSLAFGTIRWYFELAACLDRLSDRRLDRLDERVAALLLVGLYQLVHGRTPVHAAVSETVEAARELDCGRAAGLVNAVLRRYLREGPAVLEAARQLPAAHYAHPAWLIDALRRDWPGRWEAILEAGNQQPPMWLRVNAARSDVATYQARLDAAGIESRPDPLAPEALRLARPVDVERLPGFADGDVSVQDVAAQLAARLLDARPGMRVLDACAAPGGKACHLLELEPTLRLTALELDAVRAGRIRDNLRRTGLAATVVVGDAAAPAGWSDGQPWDRILLDVPCSGTGVIRRHPDIKLLRRPADIAGFASRQAAMLDALWPLLAPGGRLLYASCSVLQAENADVVGAFLGRAPEAVEQSGSARLSLPAQPPGVGTGPGLALATGAADNDGFFYACLDKRA